MNILKCEKCEHETKVGVNDILTLSCACNGIKRIMEKEMIELQKDEDGNILNNEYNRNILIKKWSKDLINYNNGKIKVNLLFTPTVPISSCDVTLTRKG